jgi:ribosomal protein S27AE
MEGNDYTTSTQGEGRCPRCGKGTLKAWYELSEEEREVARRLPASADFPLDERAARHRFCTRCWYEERAGIPRDA